MSLIDTHTHVSSAAARRGSIVAMCTITDDTVKSTVCDKFGLFNMIVSFVSPCVSPGGPRGAVRYGFPASVRFRRGRGARPVKARAPAHRICQRQRHPHPPRRTRPLPSPTPSTRRSTPGAAVRVRPPAVAQGCGLVGRRVGRRIQVQMQSVSRRPRQPTPRAAVAARRAQAPGQAWGQS